MKKPNRLPLNVPLKLVLPARYEIPVEEIRTENTKETKTTHCLDCMDICENH